MWRFLAGLAVGVVGTIIYQEENRIKHWDGRFI